MHACPAHQERKRGIKDDKPSFNGGEDMDVCLNCRIFMNRTISQIDNIKALHTIIIFHKRIINEKKLMKT